MKNFLRFSAASAILAGSLGMSTVAQAADTASADAFAEILTALAVEIDPTNNALDFGAMVVTGAGGVVTLNADGTLDCSATDIICSGTTAVPTFNITGGTVGKDVTIKITNLSENLVLVGGSAANANEVLVLSNFNSDAAAVTGTPGSFEVNLGAAVAGVMADFEIGGDLAFDGDELPGLYEGSFSLLVEYS